jgi:hypothetical protein
VLELVSEKLLQSPAGLQVGCLKGGGVKLLVYPIKENRRDEYFSLQNSPR